MILSFNIITKGYRSNLERSSIHQLMFFDSGTDIRRCLVLSWWKLMGSIRCLWHFINNCKNVSKEGPLIPHHFHNNFGPNYIITMPRTHVVGTQGAHWWFKTREQANGPSLVTFKKESLVGFKKESLVSLKKESLVVSQEIASLPASDTKYC